MTRFTARAAITLCLGWWSMASWVVAQPVEGDAARETVRRLLPKFVDVASNPCAQREFWEILGEMCKPAQINPRGLVTELVAFTSHAGEKGIYAVFLVRLLNIPPEDIAAGAEEFLLLNKDDVLRREAEQYLSMTFFSVKCPSDPIRRIEHKSEAFVEWLFSGDPERAVLGMESEEFFFKNKDISWSVHVVSDAIWKRGNGFKTAFEAAKPDAIAELEKLSRHKEYWVRLYVAKTIRNLPEFATEELKQRLADDNHRLVREAVE